MKTKHEKTGTYSYLLLKDRLNYLLIYRSSKRKGPKEAVTIGGLYLRIGNEQQQKGTSGRTNDYLEGAQGRKSTYGKNKCLFRNINGPLGEEMEDTIIICDTVFGYSADFCLQERIKILPGLEIYDSSVLLGGSAFRKIKDFRFSNAQFKIILMPKCRILGWHILIPIEVHKVDLGFHTQILLLGCSLKSSRLCGSVCYF